MAPSCWNSVAATVYTAWPVTSAQSEQAVDYVSWHLSGEASANPGGHLVIGQPGQAPVLLAQQDIDDHRYCGREPGG